MNCSKRVWVCVCAGAFVASSASAAVMVAARHSKLSASAFCGNGPASVSYSDAVEEFGLFGSGPLGIDHTTVFLDDFWGASDGRTIVNQSVDFINNTPNGFAFEGRIGADSSFARSISPSDLGAAALAQCDTDNFFDYRFTVTEATEWSLTMDATRNPTADFAVSIQNLSGGGYAYLSPLVAPFSGMAGGVLAPGTYLFHARANTRAFVPVPQLQDFDEVSNLFSLRVGEVPGPTGAGLALVAVIGAARRRRGG